MILPRQLTLCLGLSALLGISAHAQDNVSSSVRCDALAAPSASKVEISTVVKGLVNPWALVFLPDGRMLISEREGRLRIASVDGTLSPPIAGLPEVAARGQGGLLDIALDPAFARNQLIYLSYAENGEGGAGTALARASLDTIRLTLSDFRVIYRQTPKVSGTGHFGSRLSFGADGRLYASLGERQKFDPAQDPKQSLGKIVRINPDGSIPADNPFAQRAGWLPEIWTLGHRNPQGMTREPGTSRIWISEHGARGGDEINILAPGTNYGWPVISYGRHYTGLKIGEGTAKEGMAQAVCYWDPSIAPGNIAFHDGNKATAWRGNLFVAALKDEALHRLVISNGKVTGSERIPVGSRVRDVRLGSDGALYLVTDESDGQVLRVKLKD